MITNSGINYNIPDEKELEKMANQIFTDLNPDSETCVSGIENLISNGDTSVLNKAEKKFEKASSNPYFVSDFNEFFEVENVKAFSYYENLAKPENFSQEEDSYFKDINSSSSVLASSPLKIDENSSKSSANGNLEKKYFPKVYSVSESEKERKSLLFLEKVEKPFSDSDIRQEKSSSRNDSIVIGSKTLSQIRDDFPILNETINGNPLIYLDNGATTQRPRQVIERLKYYYEHENSNVHRAAHELAARSTDAYEKARETVSRFIGSPSSSDIIFVRGTTEGINLVAHSYVKPLLSPGDEIIVSILEHHANIVPWQLVCEETGAVLKVIPCDKNGNLDLDAYESLFSKKTKFVSVTHVSNVTGTINPVSLLVSIAHRHGVRILVDGAQSIAHLPVNVSLLDADFFVFSGHKIYAPTGIGCVYGKKELLEKARPYHGGGNMILDVTFERTVYNPSPNKFEAGTGSIADAVALGSALEYLESIGMNEVASYEHYLTDYALKKMKTVKGLKFVGNPENKAGVLSFKLEGHSDEEVGERLNSYGITVRTGHHCAQPVLRYFGYEGSIRPTLGLYNSPSEIDKLVQVLNTF